MDIQAEELGRNRAVDLPVLSDVRGLLTQLNRLIDQQGAAEDLRRQFAGWIAELKKSESDNKAMTRPTWEGDQVPIHPLRLAREVDDFMNREEDIVVADGGDTTTWMGMTRTVRRPGHYLDYGLFGCLAVGLPFANAASS